MTSEKSDKPSEKSEFDDDEIEKEETVEKTGKDENKETDEKNDDNKLVNIHITKDLEFHRQRGTILTWKGKTEVDEDDTAVSFQEKEGVHDIWYYNHYISF